VEMYQCFGGTCFLHHQSCPDDGRQQVTLKC
jgi:hypothetical protein